LKVDISLTMFVGVQWCAKGDVCKIHIISWNAQKREQWELCRQSGADSPQTSLAPFLCRCSDRPDGPAWWLMLKTCSAASLPCSQEAVTGHDADSDESKASCPSSKYVYPSKIRVSHCFFRHAHWNIVRGLFFFYAYYILHLSRLPPFDHPITLSAIQTMKLLTTQFSTASCFLILPMSHSVFDSTCLSGAPPAPCTSFLCRFQFWWVFAMYWMPSSFMRAFLVRVTGRAACSCK